MIGFMPDVEINKSLSIFNPRLMRTQTYLFNQSILSQNTYTFLTFNADTSFFKKEKEYNILETGLMNLSTVTDSPLLVSQLYYSGGNFHHFCYSQSIIKPLATFV